MGSSLLLRVSQIHNYLMFSFQTLIVPYKAGGLKADGCGKLNGIWRTQVVAGAKFRRPVGYLQ